MDKKRAALELVMEMAKMPCPLNAPPLSRACRAGDPKCVFCRAREIMGTCPTVPNLEQKFIELRDALAAAVNALDDPNDLDAPARYPHHEFIERVLNEATETADMLAQKEREV